MGWERVDAPRRGRRGYFAHRAVVGPTSGPSGCGWDNGRGQVGAGGTMVGADVPGGPSPARGAAGRPTTEPRAGVGCRRARGTRAPTNVGAIVRQGQPTWGPVRTPRAGGGAGTSRAGPSWEAVDLAVGGVLVEGGADPAATSAALPCRRGCRGRAISRRSSSEVKSRIPKPAARRRAKYPRRPRRGTSKRARRRARPRQARPSRVAEVQETRDFTSEQFRSEIPHHQTHGGSVAVLRSAQKDREKVGGGLW